MIPGLLHQRIGGAGSSGVIAIPAYALTQGFAVGQYSAEVTAGFTIKPNGTWETSEPWYTDESGVWYNPITAGIGSGYEARITLTRLAVTEPGVTDAAGIITNAAANWVSLSADRAITLKLQRFTQGRSISSYSAKVEIRAAGSSTIISTGNFSFGVQVQVDSTLPSGGGEPACVEVGMWLQPGLRAGEVQIDDEIDGAGYDPIGIVPRKVRANPVALAQCWRIATGSGASVIASETTPMTLRDGSTAYIPDMLGLDVLVNDAEGTRWEPVTSCLYVGERHVVKINVGDTCYFAGEDPSKRIATHNAQVKP